MYLFSVYRFRSVNIPFHPLPLVFSAGSLRLQHFYDVVTVSGGRPSLICVVTSDLRPVVFTFLDRLGSIIDPVMNSNFQVMNTGPTFGFLYTSTLTFLRNVTIDDEGLYTCTFADRLDTARDTAFLTVNGTSTLATLRVCVILTH